MFELFGRGNGSIRLSGLLNVVTSALVAVMVTGLGLFGQREAKLGCAIAANGIG